MPAIRTVGIRGAGLSGLSIARELHRINPEITISIFDLRPRLPHPQRTFCFFNTNHAFQAPCPTTTWNSIAFSSTSFQRHIHVPMTPYTMIRGDDFFDSTLRQLESGGVTFHWSCSSVELADNSILVDGNQLTFDCIIDAAFEPSLSTPLLWQSFAGIWVTSTSPIFDPTTAILMDLQESDTHTPVRFLYILPTSYTTALIEHTTFSPTALPRDYHLQYCTSWLKRYATHDFKIQEYEYGAIPMGLRPHSSSAHHIVGSNAGAVRPATGYAFLAVQQHARILGEHVLLGTTAPLPMYPFWLTCGDRIFLHALAHSPAKGGTVLEKLLSRSPSEALIAFLSGNATLRQAITVWLSVPKIEMLRSLVRI